MATQKAICFKKRSKKKALHLKYSQRAVHICILQPLQPSLFPTKSVIVVSRAYVKKQRQNFKKPRFKFECIRQQHDLRLLFCYTKFLGRAKLSLFVFLCC